MKLCIAGGHAIYLSNESTDLPVTFVPGQLIAGFYTGKWSNQKATDEIPDNAILFALKDSNDLVVHGGKLVTLSEVLGNKAKTAPDDAEVRYHSKRDSPLPGDAAHFVLEVQHKVIYVLTDTPQKSDDEGVKSLPHSHIASALPHQCWRAPPWSDIIWSTKWSAKGLSPVRPSVLVTREFTVPPGNAVCLHSL